MHPPVNRQKKELEMQSNIFQDVLNINLNRRNVLGAMAAIPALNLIGTQADAQVASFKSVPENNFDTVTVPEGYEWNKLISWGDALVEGIDEPKIQPGPPFVFNRLEQERRMGMCNDMMAIFPKKYQYPWPENGKEWIFCSNNEYVVPYLMLKSDGGKLNASAQEVEALYAAQGVTVYEVRHEGTNWNVVKNPSLGKGLNRRITPFTEVVYDGPAKNHPWIKRAAEITNESEKLLGNLPKNKDGVLSGTMQNCAGGYTPWGTYLTCEENIDNMFFISDQKSQKLADARNDAGFDFDQKSFGLGNDWKLGGPMQFDIAKSPNGPSLYGWIVEIDPYDPNWAPRKHTALGRKKNESATTVICKSGQIAVYTGDDQSNEFVYKFITTGKFDAKNRVKNRVLLSSGKLYAARFESDGTGHWIEINLKAANAAPCGEFDKPFKDEGDLMVRAREAARRLGATQMDRPEDVESPVDGTFIGKGAVYVVCTGNQTSEGINGNAANPRRTNQSGANEMNYTGQIIRINEENGDHAKTKFTWEVFVMGGDHSAEYAPNVRNGGETHNLSSWKDGKPTTLGDRFAMPDNITFDKKGFAFFTTDGTPDSFPCNDGIYVVSTHAPAPRTVKRFLTGPIGCEITGPLLSRDNKTFFCGLQHIGDEDPKGNRYRGKEEKPHSTFPNNVWPRDTIVYVTKKDGGFIGD